MRRRTTRWRITTRMMTTWITKLILLLSGASKSTYDGFMSFGITLPNVVLFLWEAINWMDFKVWISPIFTFSRVISTERDMRSWENPQVRCSSILVPPRDISCPDIVSSSYVKFLTTVKCPAGWTWLSFLIDFSSALLVTVLVRAGLVLSYTSLKMKSSPDSAILKQDVLHIFYIVFFLCSSLYFNV